MESKVPLNLVSRSDCRTRTDVAPDFAHPATSAADIAPSPPATFKKVSSLDTLPDFVPGLGTLYVDPASTAGNAKAMPTSIAKMLLVVYFGCMAMLGQAMHATAAMVEYQADANGGR